MRLRPGIQIARFVFLAAVAIAMLPPCRGDAQFPAKDARAAEVQEHSPINLIRDSLSRDRGRSIPAASRLVNFAAPALLTREEMRNPEAQPPGFVQAAPVPAADDRDVHAQTVIRRDAALPMKPAGWVMPLAVFPKQPANPIAGQIRLLAQVRLVDGFGVADQAEPSAPAAESLTPALNTSEDLERMLDRADQIVTAGRPDLASVLWQRVLDEGVGVLATQAGGVQQTSQHTFQRYRPLQEEVERRIAAAGPQALRAYRLNSDGQAQALLAGSDPAERERSLAEVVRRFFLTTIGDDAAFELGCLQLERREYAAATQWLAKLRQYPDTTIPSAQIVARLSVALSHLGSVASATELLSGDETISSELKDLLLASFDGLGGADVAQWTPTDWPMPFGNPSRSGLMSDVTGIDLTRPLGDVWEYLPHFTLKSAAPTPQGKRVIRNNINGRVVQILLDDNNRVVQTNPDSESLPDLSRADLAARWRDTGWQPVGELLFADGRMLLKAEDRVVCCATDTGAVLWMGRKTKYPLDPELQQTAAFAAAGMVVEDDGSKRPRTLTETVLFGDRVAQGMTVAGDLVLNVEGELDYLKKPPAKQQDPNQALQWMMMRGQAPAGADQGSRNWLAAYDLPTGKLRWHRGAADTAEAGGRFLCAPLPVGESLFVAVGDETRIVMAALDRGSGATLWRVTLCDTPSEGRVPQAPVGLAAGEGDLYITTGSGTVFALDALSGSVKWAAAYPRRMPKYLGQAQVLMRAMQGGDASATATFSRAEFRDNIVLRHANLVVVLASDFDYALALDCQSGTLRWEAPLAPTGSSAAAEYCLGILEGRLYLGGPRVLRAYDLNGGKLDWERPLDGSCGRGLLTHGGLYVPEKDHILNLDPSTGALVNSTTVNAPDGAPVGNLYSDRGRLFALGAARVSALGPVAKPEPEATP